MIWFLIAIIIILIIYIMLYKLQVNNIGLELIQIQKKDYTNQVITQELNSKELNQLINSINQTIDKERELRIKLIRHQDQFDNLMTNLSHDIRTPLTSVSGFIQLLEDSKTQEDKERYYRIIYDRLDQLNTMFNDLFTYMKLENDHTESHLEIVDWKEFISQHLLSYYDLLSNKGIKLEIELPDEIVQISADKKLLMRVHDNIINNIIKHGGKNTTLSLIMEELGPDKKSYAKLMVINDLNPHPVSDVKKDSSKLGLTIIKLAVEKMQGEINIQKDHDFSISIILPTVQ